MAKQPENKEITVPALDYYPRPAIMTQKQVVATQAEYFIMRSVNRASWVFRQRRDEVWNFMNNLQTNFSFEGMAVEEGRTAMREFVFNNNFNREFLKTITVGFTALHSEWHGGWDSLLYNIAYGLGDTPISSEANLTLGEVPDELTSRAYTTTEIYEWLKANNWASILTMVKMWGVVPDDF